MKLISIHNLAIIDMALHGRKFILIEFIGAVAIAFAIGGYILLKGWSSTRGLLIGVGISGIGFNYLPLVIYALQLKSGQHIDETLPTWESKKKYTIQSLLLFIPFLMLIVAILQVLIDSRHAQPKS